MWGFLKSSALSVFDTLLTSSVGGGKDLIEDAHPPSGEHQACHIINPRTKGVQSTQHNTQCHLYYGYSQDQTHHLWSIQLSATVWSQLTKFTSYIPTVGKLYYNQAVILQLEIYIVANRPGFPWIVQRFDSLSRGPGNRTKFKGNQRFETTLKLTK